MIQTLRKNFSLRVCVTVPDYKHNAETFIRQFLLGTFRQHYKNQCWGKMTLAKNF